MFDELKKFWSREVDEFKQNKNRIGAIVVCLVVLIIFWLSDDSSRGEEIDLSTSTVDAPSATNDLPAKVLPVEKNPDGVTIVIGANADALIVANPFAGQKKSTPPPKPVAPVKSVPPIVIQPPTVQPTPQPTVQPPREEIILTGTAISGNVKTAMFLHGKETIFLTVGEEIDGRRIVDITPDSVTFADGEILTIRN